MKTVSLQNVLRINAASSAATGLLLVSFPKVVQEIFAVTASWPFTEAGLFLIGFSLVVFYVSRSNPIQDGGVRFIIALDSLWVLASAVLVLIQPFSISIVGNLMIVAVALWVTVMIYLQVTGRRAYASSK